MDSVVLEVVSFVLLSLSIAFHMSGNLKNIPLM